MRLDTQTPESAQCYEKQQSPCEREGGGGLKFEETNAVKHFSSLYLRIKWV